MSDPDVKRFNRNLMKALVDDNDKQRAEIERLKAALSVAGLWRDLGEENQRLTAALRAIANADPEYVHSRLLMDAARAALEGKFPTKKICPECGQRMREDGYCDHVPF